VDRCALGGTNAAGGIGVIARLLAVGAIALILPLPVVIVVAPLMWVLIPRILHALPTARSRTRDRERFERAALLVDALAAHLVAGISLLESLDSVAEIDDGDLGRATRDCGQLIRMGSIDPFAPWQQWPYLAPLARELSRAVTRGGSLASAAKRAARDLRAEEIRRRRTAVEQVTIRVAIPVSLCLLPAFILLAVVPPAVSLFTKADLPSTTPR
jgi:type II secretory pathway component PulF